MGKIKDTNSPARAMATQITRLSSLRMAARNLADMEHLSNPTLMDLLMLVASNTDSRVVSMVLMMQATRKAMQDISMLGLRRGLPTS